jgi:maleylpyruvate isomerase
LREVEVHHVDLNGGYGPADWDYGWVLEEMDRAMLSLSSRLPEDTAVVLTATDSDQHWVAGSGDAIEVSGPLAQIFAWVTGRATSVGGQEAPSLGPWR